MSKHTSRKPAAPASETPSTPAAAQAAKPESKKTKCPISRTDFDTHAKPVEIVVNGAPMVVPVKEFSTGSLGWYLNGKTVVKVGETPVTVQIGLNMTIVGSKELPQ